MIERKNSEFYTNALREMRKKESELEKKLRQIENTRLPDKQEDRAKYVYDLMKTKDALDELRLKKLKYLFELENLKDEKADFESEEYCECIGYCYGKGIYVNNEGDILYADVEKNGADAVGEPAFTPTGLKLLEVLPEAEKNMILNYLDEAEETPLWFKTRNA